MTHIELSPKQKSIVYAANGPLCVLASAGSGKTRVLTERVRHLLGQTKRRVLALTFTNKAGEEIKERIKDIPDLEKRVFVGTFHSFCQTVLENHGQLLGMRPMPHIFEETSDRLELVGQAISQTPSYYEQYKRLNKKEQNQVLYRVLEVASKFKRELIDHSDFPADEEHLPVLIYRNYQDILRAQNAIDFDDLILLTYKLFINYPVVAGLYRRSFFAICTDEAQDLNHAQYHLLLALANGELTNVMMVGDPNQSIYHFNGSDARFLCDEFVKDFSPEVIKLDENYRSAKKVLHASSMIIPEAEYIEGTIKQGRFVLQGLENEVVEATWVFDEIKALLATKKHDDIEGEIVLEKMAVLARNRYIFSQLERLLQQANIPYNYHMTPGALQFESDLMKVFDLALRVKLNPLDRLHYQRLQRHLKLSASNDNSLESLAAQVTAPMQKALVLLVTGLSEDGANLKKSLEQFRQQLVVEDENEKIMIFNDITELLNHWLNYASKTDQKSLHQFKNAMTLGKTHPLAQHTGITLGTVHTMKGQEYDIVFIIGLDDGTFPDYRAQRKGGIEMVQEKNNLYVAFTRAKRFLYASWPRQRAMPWGDISRRSISSFLLPFNER